MEGIPMPKARGTYLLFGATATAFVMFFLSQRSDLRPPSVFEGHPGAVPAIEELNGATLQSTLEAAKPRQKEGRDYAGGRDINDPFPGGEEGFLTTLPSPALNSLVQTAIQSLQAQEHGSSPGHGSKAASSLCGRFRDAFSAPPSVIQLPMATDSISQGDELNETNSVYFTMVNSVDSHTSLSQNHSTRRGYSLYVYSRDDIVSDNLLSKSSWESDEISRTLGQLYRFAEEKGLQPANVTFVDIGANIGTHTLAVASHGFRVIAFEPLLSNALALQLSMCLNPGMEDLILLINKGLAGAMTNCTLISGIQNAGDGFLRCGNDTVVVGPGYAKRATLDVTRLDDALRGLLPSLKGRVGAVKMDVEGYEPQVIAGGARFFREVKPPYVVSECDDAMIQGGAGKPAGQYLMQMSKLGYSVRIGSTEEIPATALESTECGKLATVYFKPRPVASLSLGTTQE